MKLVYTKEMKAVRDRELILNQLKEKGSLTFSKLRGRMPQRSNEDVEAVVSTMIADGSIVQEVKIHTGPGRPCYLYSLPVA